MPLLEVAHQSSSNLYGLIPLVVFLPVAGLLINILVGKRFGEKFIGITASLATLGSLAIAVLMFIALNQDGFHTVQIPFADWIHVGAFELDWVFRIDTLSTTMMLVVAGVGSLIHIYAVGYMHYDVRYKEDPGAYNRFFIYMNLFIAMMMILVTGDSYLMLFVGWEGVGLCSYLLIGFWFNRNPDASIGVKNSIAGKKAFVVNRIGDFGFLIAIFITFWAFGSLQFDEVFHQMAEGHFTETIVIAITLFMLLGVTGKSAQLPLFVWLPDAMAGPTPVSALIHAATMVTAGVYLVARSAPLFSAVPAAQNVVALVGGITALVAATIAVGQYDIKKVLAYSTVSQLGFMVAAVGMGAYVAGIFHLVTHAFFKALLFLSAGSVILAVERGHHPLEGDGGHEHSDEHAEHHSEAFDPQDMRNMGGLRKKIPVTYWVYMAGTLALAGIPPLAGFFSKDEILAHAQDSNIAVYILLTLAAFLTAFYMGRQIWMVFFGKPRSHAAEVAKESPPVMTIPLMVLAGLSIVSGFMNFPTIHAFTDWLEHTFAQIHVHLEHVSFNWFVAISSTVLGLIAIYLSWVLYNKKPFKQGAIDPLRKMLGEFFVILEEKWFLDEVYEVVIVQPYKDLAHFLAQKLDWEIWHDWFHDSAIALSFRRFARFLANPIDLGIIDGLANGIASTVKELAEDLRSFQNGFIRSYALSVFFGVVLILGYLIIFR